MKMINTKELQESLDWVAEVSTLEELNNLQEAIDILKFITD